VLKVSSKHVVEDLRPYICIENECSTADREFETEREWMEHLRWEHSLEWWCDGDGTAHEPQKFVGRDDFEDHIRNDHQQMTEKQIAIISELAARPSATVFEFCPFCDFHPKTETALLLQGPRNADEVLEKASQIDPSQIDFQRHVRDHLLEFFLHALPEREDLDEQSFDTDPLQENRSTLKQLDSVLLERGEQHLNDVRGLGADVSPKHLHSVPIAQDQMSQNNTSPRVGLQVPSADGHEWEGFEYFTGTTFEEDLAIDPILQHFAAQQQPDGTPRVQLPSADVLENVTNRDPKVLPQSATNPRTQRQEVQPTDLVTPHGGAEDPRQTRGDAAESQSTWQRPANISGVPPVRSEYASSQSRLGRWLRKRIPAAFAKGTGDKKVSTTTAAPFSGPFLFTTSVDTPQQKDRSVASTSQQPVQPASIRHESGLVKTGSQLVSDKVDSVVILGYNGKTHRALDGPIRWLDKSQYTHFDYAADRWLRDWGALPDSIQLYRKSGRCRLISHEDNREFDSKILENEEQWSEVLPYLITSFVSKHPYIKFYLEILWEYSDLSINKVENEPYAVTVRKVIHGKSKLNWQNDRFIPRKDLVEILSESTVKELINNDRSLNKIQYLDKDKFIQEVALDASRLLAICVYVDLPLACLYELTQQGHSDIDLPLTELHCPMGTYEVSFSNFVLWQGAFIAHDFEDDEGPPKHRKLADDVVLPIMFNEKQDLLGEGGFSWVYKVRIDPDHHFFSAVSYLCPHSW
jgi:hypothetical protein